MESSEFQWRREWCNKVEDVTLHCVIKKSPLYCTWLMSGLDPLPLLLLSGRRRAPVMPRCKHSQMRGPHPWVPLGDSRPLRMQRTSWCSPHMSHRDPHCAQHLWGRQWSCLWAFQTRHWSSYDHTAENKGILSKIHKRRRYKCKHKAIAVMCLTHLRTFIQQTNTHKHKQPRLE